MGIRQRIGELLTGGRQVVSEIIGRVSYLAASRISRWMRSDDRTQADYEWFDKLRRGKLPTYKLGALFCKPIVDHINSWSLGEGFRALTDDDTTNESLSTFIDDHLLDIIVFVQEGMGLGDAYLVVNTDGTLTAVPPNQVDIETNPLDYRDVIAYTITTVLETATITDRYTMEKRIITIKQADQPERVIEYPNLIGRLPVIHLPYGASTNEVYGHPFYEALVPLFAEYDDVLTNSLMGVKTMSNPIPTLEGVEDPAKELEALATRTETYTDSAGNTVTENVVDVDALSIIATKGRFELKAPNSFTADAWQMLKALFLLMLQHSNVPEWVWGGAIASSKASVDAQMPAWSKFISLQRMMIERPIRQLLEVYLATIALYTPGIQSGLKITIEWPEVAPEDAALHLDYVRHAGERGLITGERELELLNLVRDAAEEYRAAIQEVQQQRQQMDQFSPAWEEAMNEALNRANQQQPEEEEAA